MSADVKRRRGREHGRTRVGDANGPLREREQGIRTTSRVESLPERLTPGLRDGYSARERGLLSRSPPQACCWSADRKAQGVGGPHLRLTPEMLERARRADVWQAEFVPFAAAFESISRHAYGSRHG